MISRASVEMIFIKFWLLPDSCIRFKLESADEILMCRHSNNGNPLSSTSTELNCLESILVENNFLAAAKEQKYLSNYFKKDKWEMRFYSNDNRKLSFD